MHFTPIVSLQKFNIYIRYLKAYGHSRRRLRCMVFIKMEKRQGHGRRQLPIKLIMVNREIMYADSKILAPVADRLSGIQEYYFSTKLRQIDEMNKAGKDVINLGIGSPDLPPDPSVIKTLADEAAKPNQHGYQNYKGSPVLRNA